MSGNRDLLISIKATDAASLVFRKLGASAKEATREIEGGAKQAARSVDQLSESTARSQTAMKSAESAGRSFAVGIAALGASFALYSRSVISQEQSIAALQRQYGAAANGFLAFANTVASNSVFNDDEIIAAINSMAVLRREYGLTDTQIQALIQRSADLAALNPGMGLVDAAERVQAAVRGEAESIEKLGVVSSDSALGIDRMATTTTNAEKAAIRYTAIMSGSSFAVGAAGDQADTTAGKIQKLSNFVDDTAQSFISMTGPLGEGIGAIASFSLQSGLALASVGPLIKGVRDLTVALRGMQAAEGGSLLGGIGSALGGGASAAGAGGLAASLGAVAAGALAVTAAFLPLIGVLGYVAITADDAKNAMTGQTEQITAWAKAISDPALREGYTYLAQDIRDFNVAVQDMQTGQVVDITDALDELLALNPGDLAKLTEILKANNIEIGNLDPNNVEQLTIVYNALMQVYGEHAAYQQQMAEVAQSHQQAITDLEEQYGSLTTTTVESTESFKDLWFTLHASELATRKTADAQNELNRILDAGRITLGSYTDEQMRQQGKASEAAATNKGEYAGSLRSVSTQLKDSTSDVADMRAGIDALNDALRDSAGNQFAQEIRTQDQALLDYLDTANSAAKAVGLLSSNAQLFQAAGIKAPALDVAVTLQTGQGAFDAVFGAIKTAQSLASSIGGAKSWADELIGDPGAWSELDKLLEEGRITAQQYSAAQAAQVSISQDVTNAQRDLLAVQTNLAPVLAEVTRQQAQYIDGLQDLNPQQQLAALGMMDQVTSSKALELAQLAAASSTDAMQASTTKMIQAAVDADPALRAVLTQMGLISDTDGKIAVNFDEATSAKTATEELTKSIDALTIALGGIPPIHTSTNAASTQKDVDGLTDAINDVPTSVSTTITAVDNATGAIAAVKQSLLDIDNMTARTYLENYQTTTYRTVGVGPTAGMTGLTMSAFATGGTVGPSTRDIPRYVTGGSHALVGEAGPEMVWLPNGAQVTNAVATKAELMRERRRRGGGGDINIYGPMTLNPAGSDAYDAIQQEMRGGARR